jgi:RNA polymerase-binding transcription factor DksA
MSSEIQTLEARRDELNGRIKAIHRDLGRGLEKDYEEQAIQLENLEVLQEIARVAEAELRKIELELARLKASPTD